MSRDVTPTPHHSLARLAAARARAAERLASGSAADGEAWLRLDERWRDLLRRLSSSDEVGALSVGLSDVVITMADDLAAAFDRFRPVG